MYNNSNEEKMMVEYSSRYDYESLVSHMLDGVATDNCSNKADAHLALCIKSYLEFGNLPELAHNCYDDEDKYGNESGNESDFYIFRSHTRQLTDYLDEKLKWDMITINKELIEDCTRQFLTVAKDYKFKMIVWDMKNEKHVPLRKYMRYDSWIWKKGLDINWELIGD